MTQTGQLALSVFSSHLAVLLTSASDCILKTTFTDFFRSIPWHFFEPVTESDVEISFEREPLAELV